MRRFLPALLLAACAATGNPLARVDSWAAQFQGLEAGGAVARLAASRYDMLVLDPTRSVQGSESVPVAAAVARLHAAGKLCLAYFNVGQAEDYRTYWRDDWRAPADGAPGRPDFLVSVDPDGWEGNYPVAYWDPRWRALLHRRLDPILADGFDGVYLDWILGYEEPPVVAVARRAGVDPARAMAELLHDLRAYARAQRPGFVLLAQNGAFLADRAPSFVAAIDGFSQECLTFRGDAGAAWGDPKAGDIAIPATGEAWSTEALGARLAALRARGVPVFTLDYALEPANAAHARAVSRRYGAVPFVSQAPLDRLP